MKYIEEIGNVTKEYDVKINDVELENIINELDEKLRIRCRGIQDVMAVSEDDAAKKLSNGNKTDIKILSQKRANELYKGLPSNNNLFIFKCEFLVNNYTYLSYILKSILGYYREKNSIVTGESRAINLLLDYANDAELVPFEELMARNGITNILYEKYENNKDFDFALLKELYERALACFELKLVKETETTTYEEGVGKVYKFGTR